MKNWHLNIISLDVPYPANYGGVIDIFYKIKALENLGVKVHLHCFEYGRGEQVELERYCSSVTYYKRNTGLRANVSYLPYIINSRQHIDLLANLNSNQFPILLEGLHTTFWYLKGALKGREILLRSHNVEHDYYQFLAKQTSNLLKKLFFKKEAFLLKRVFRHLPKSTSIAAISVPDTEAISKQYPNTIWLPPFHPNEKLSIRYGKGEYLLYHGNLSVEENIRAALFLVEAFGGTELSVVFAGRNPSQALKIALGKFENLSLVENPEAAEMNGLIRAAHIILLPTFQPTGIKLKLLDSLYKGRFCLANSTMVEGTLLDGLCTVIDSNWYAEAKKIMKKDFTQEMGEERTVQLNKYYSNERNAVRILELFEKK